MVEGIVLTNTITGYELALDMVSTPYYILESVSWGAVQGSHNTNRYVGQVGETIVSTSLGMRDVEITGWIIAGSCPEMTERKAFLNAFIDPQQPLQLGYNGYELTFSPDASVQYAQGAAENNDVMSKFSITGVAADPMFRSENHTRIEAATTVPAFRFPLTLSTQPDPPGGFIFGYREPSLIAKVFNRGSVSVGLVVEFKATGDVTNPSLTLIETQEVFKIKKAMKVGEVIRVSTVIGNKYIKGITDGAESNYFKYRDLASRWIQLRPGENSLRYAADTGSENLDVSLSYSTAMLEVEACS